MQGFIVKSLAGDFYVLNQDNNKIYTCKAKGQFRNKNLSPICGDLVIFDHDEANNFSIITDILPRKNELIRPPIANIDIALIVMSTVRPNFDFYLVDKLIVAATLQNIEPVIVVSKCEYLDDELKKVLDNYTLAGYKVIMVSSHENINIDQVDMAIKGKKVVLCGQSAVGKSSLINSLLKTEHRMIGDYSEKLGRGKHKTREVEFIFGNGGYVADSPGFSRLDLNIEIASMARIYKDFEKLANNCRFASCMHINEPNCAVKDAVEKDIINKKRYDNYLHIIKEIKDGKQVWRKK